jgi:ferredoxin
VLVQINGAADEDRFQKLLDECRNTASEEDEPLREAPPHVARWLWHDRWNPLKIQLLGPSLLAGELLMNTADASAYIDAAIAVARRFKVELRVEAHFVRAGTGDVEMLLIPMILTDRRRCLMYLAHIMLIPMLTRLGVRMGGRPYGIGIWNTPFLRDLHADAHLERLRAFKHRVDPGRLLNPGKFWRLRSRFCGVPGLALLPAVFRIIMDGFLFLSRWAGALVPAHRSTPTSVAPDRWLAEIASQCTQCGNCVAVCPAYQITKNERTTARFKLRLGECLAEDADITQSEADAFWLCTRCGECERVCQTELPLLVAYDAIESRLESRFGRPDDSIRTFVDGLGQNQDYLELIESEPFRSS